MIKSMEMSIDKALEKGIAAHKEGKLQSAERLYRAILQVQPDHPDANHNLGILAVSVGKAAQAIPFFQRALEVNAQSEQFWVSYIRACTAAGQFDIARQAIADGERSGIASKKLDSLQQQVQPVSSSCDARVRPDLTKSERRKRTAGKTKSKNRKVRDIRSAAGPSRAQINNLLQTYQAGNSAESERLARSLTQEFPNHPFGWQILGAVLRQQGQMGASLLPMQKSAQLLPQQAAAHYNLGNTLKALGRLEQAEASYGRAIALKPDFAEAHNNRGNTLKALGRLNEAEASCRQAVACNAGFTEAHNCLGAVLQELGRFEEAEASYKCAICLTPDYAPAHNNLSATLLKLGRLNEAEACCREAVRLEPDSVASHNNLGNVLKELRKLEEAEASYRQALDINPDIAEVCTNLGITLKELGRLDEAEAYCRQAIKIKPAYADAHNNLGLTLHALEKLEDAELSYDEAKRLNPTSPKIHNNLGNLLLTMSRFEEAESNFRQAIALRPDYAIAHNNLGTALQDLGRFDEAKASLNNALAIQPDITEAHRNLALMKVFASPDEQFRQMQALYRDPNLSEDRRCHICFALAKAFEDMNCFSDAFRFFTEGNALRKKKLGYQKDQNNKLFEILKIRQTQMLAHPVKPGADTSGISPIFILGMPRSGTTLVEQIISSLPHVTGAGELPFVSQYGSALAAGHTAVSDRALKNFRGQYLAALRHRSEGHSIVTDKMPQNFHFIGLIAATLPEAKIVHVKREPAAVCWANYTQYFVRESLSYCYDLDDILHYYELYEQLMEKWHQLLPGRIIDLNYEALTKHQGDETRKLINYLGLEWDDACLSPQYNGRHVATASNAQVRQEVYQGSSERWKRYRPFLNGVLDHFRNPRQ